MSLIVDIMCQTHLHLKVLLIQIQYPLVDVYMTLENHHFVWKNIHVFDGHVQWLCNNHYQRRFLLLTRFSLKIDPDVTEKTTTKPPLPHLVVLALQEIEVT